MYGPYNQNPKSVSIDLELNQVGVKGSLEHPAEFGSKRFTSDPSAHSATEGLLWELSDSVERLHGHIAELSKKVHPALLPVDSVECDEGEKASVSSELVMNLRVS